mmetsp:Transcript_9555/g.13186  ORF Transcript_9555/g.13186 Transcript_9555/m.13186 type:complete len:295 (-) Transcript_9555:1479-2363(-)
MGKGTAAVGQGSQQRVVQVQHDLLVRQGQLCVRLDLREVRGQLGPVPAEEHVLQAAGAHRGQALLVLLVHLARGHALLRGPDLGGPEQVDHGPGGASGEVGGSLAAVGPRAVVAIPELELGVEEHELHGRLQAQRGSRQGVAEAVAVGLEELVVAEELQLGEDQQHRGHVLLGGLQQQAHLLPELEQRLVRLQGPADAVPHAAQGNARAVGVDGEGTHREVRDHFLDPGLAVREHHGVVLLDGKHQLLRNFIRLHQRRVKIAPVFIVGLFFTQHCEICSGETEKIFLFVILCGH